MKPFNLKRPTAPLWKDFDFIINKVSAQETRSILKIGFALSKLPQLHRAYVLGVCNNLGSTVSCSSTLKPSSLEEKIILLHTEALAKTKVAKTVQIRTKVIAFTS